MLAAQPQFTPDHPMPIYLSKPIDICPDSTVIIPQTAAAALGCTTILTTTPSDYATFIRTLRRHGLISESYSLIELQQVKKRLAYIHKLNVMVAQMNDLSELRYMNPSPSPVLLTGTARCFNVRQAPCDTIVVADFVWDKDADVYYECSKFHHWLPLKAAENFQVGGYFSETNLRNISKMQDDPFKWRDLVAYDEESCSFAQLCKSYGWEWGIVKTVTNDIGIPNARMREHAAQIVAEYIIDLIESRSKN